MALVVPDIQSITNGSTGYDFQAVEDQTDWAAQAASEAGTGVITGMAVSPSSGMTVAVAAGTYMVNGTVYTYAGGTVTATSASVSDRRDIVSINTSGTLAVTAGTACGTAGWTRSSSGLPPVKPAIPSASALLGELAITSTTTTIASINIVDKTTIVARTPGTLLARAQYAPSSAGSYTLVVSTTGLTALDTTNLNVVFTAPPSGAVRVRLQGFVQGGAAAGTKTVFGVVSTTSSPGTVVGVTGLVNLTPTATAADDGQLCVMDQVITGLTPGSSYTWYFAAMYSGTQTKVIPQGVTANNTVPTGAPALIEVFAA